MKLTRVNIKDILPYKGEFREEQVAKVTAFVKGTLTTFRSSLIFCVPRSQTHLYKDEDGNYYLLIIVSNSANPPEISLSYYEGIKAGWEIAPKKKCYFYGRKYVKPVCGRKGLRQKPFILIKNIYKYAVNNNLFEKA